MKLPSLSPKKVAIDTQVPINYNFFWQTEKKIIIFIKIHQQFCYAFQMKNIIEKNIVQWSLTEAMPGNSVHLSYKHLLGLVNWVYS